MDHTVNATTRLAALASLTEAHDDLLVYLEFAVPLASYELAATPPAIREEVMRTWMQRAADTLGTYGDALTFAAPDGKRSASTRRNIATAAGWLAHGIAAAAYRPGGITIGGRHWCADHTQCGGGAS